MVNRMFGKERNVCALRRGSGINVVMAEFDEGQKSGGSGKRRVRTRIGSGRMRIGLTCGG